MSRSMHIAPDWGTNLNLGLYLELAKASYFKEMLKESMVGVWSSLARFRSFPILLRGNPRRVLPNHLKVARTDVADIRAHDEHVASVS